jgi:DNA-binding NtrC family response regulator
MFPQTELTVLHIEDSADDRRSVARALQSNGGDVTLLTASSWDEASLVCLSTQFDAVLLDIGLEDRDCLELVRDLSTASPVIVLTGRESIPSAVRAIQLGAFDYLVKDVQGDYLQSLLDSIRNAVAQGQAERGYKQLSEAFDSPLRTDHTHGKLIPICSSCRKVRNEEGYWQLLEAYIREIADVAFSHGYCPACMVDERKRMDL